MKSTAVFALTLIVAVSAFGEDALTIYPNGDVKASGRVLDETGLVMPPGAILPYAGSVVPEGWLLCDGDAKSRTEFADLFAVVGTAFGSGDGSSTFNLPDLRGLFLRGRDGDAERDPGDSDRISLIAGGAQGDNVGSYQADAFQGHWHQVYQRNLQNQAVNLGGDLVPPASSATFGTPTTTYSTVKDETLSGNEDPRRAVETRPINLYVNFIIKT